MIAKLPKTFLYLAGLLLILNLIQSFFTELIFDEAYYWYYSQNMAWGYFDHPPMVAWLIKMSSLFFDGELGVRFMSCILSVGTYIFLWLLVDNPEKNKHIPLFFILGFSITLLNAYGFLTLPDTPLLFFTAFFLWVYKKFLQEQSFSLALLLGIVIAALMYSKYHAVLVIVFVLLSNIKLVLNKYAWLAVIISLLCFSPHFLWLMENDFVSIKYHISERPNQAYSFMKFTVGFFVNLIALFGFTFPIVYYILYKTRPTDKFTKALLYLTYGVVLFFFVSSFNRRVQTQWLIIIAIPLMVMVYRYILDNSKSRKRIFRLGIINIVLLLYGRLWLVHQPLLPIVYESHGNKEWVRKITDQVGDIPVIFENSYRNAPMFTFYSGNPSFSLNNIMYRQNQYTIDSSEFRLQHKKILYVSRYLKDGDISYKSATGDQYYGIFINNFESYRKLRCYVDQKFLELQSNNTHTLKVYNPYQENIDLNKLKFKIAYLNSYKQVQEVVPLPVEKTNPKNNFLKARDTTYFSFQLPNTEIDGLRYCKISISENGLQPGLNGQTIELK